MGNNRKPRKAHRPKRDAIPICFRHGVDEDRAMQIMPHSELSKLTAGDGDSVSWNTICCRLNIGLTLATVHFPDAKRVVTGALNALCDVRERFQRVGKYGLSGDEARMIGLGLVTTDDMQLSTTRRDLRAVIEYVYEQGAL